MTGACPVCGAPHEPGDRFCRACGAPLTAACLECSAAIPHGAANCPECGAPSPGTGTVLEHRLVTALYTDLVASTALAESLDPEDLAVVVGAVHEVVREEIEDRGGSVGAFVGDGVLGIFGLPVAHEDDPERALGAAGAIITRLEGMERDLAPRLGVDLAVRIGVNTGDLLAPSTPELTLGSLAGDVLNVAARLQEVAPPGGVVAAERTARSAARFHFDDLGMIDVRGRARPIHAFAVTGESAERPVSLHGPFLGREEALGSLKTLFGAAVAEGEPVHAIVIGDPGVGKSRLVREFIDWAGSADPGLTTLVGRCLPYGEDVSYRPLVEMTAEGVGVRPGEDADVVLGRIGSAVADTDEALALARLMGASEPGKPVAPGRTRELLRGAVRDLLTAIADNGPVVAVVEDVHWATDALLDVLDHAVRRARGPVMLITPARPEVLERRWSHHDGGAAVVTVPPLEAGLGRLLAARLLAEAGLPTGDRETIAERSGGNPFFMEELVRQLALHRRDTDHEDAVLELPATIQGVVSARIDLLEDTDRRVLQAASVVGRIFWPGALARMAGLDEETVLESLGGLEALHMVRHGLRSSLPGRQEWLFQHSLIGEAAYARLSRRDLARMHGALADWLVEQGSDRVGEQLAFHTARAHEAAEATAGFPDGEVERLRTLAHDRLIDAAAIARRRAALERSVRIARQSLAIATGPAEAWRSYEQIGLSRQAGYDGDAAWEAFTAALEARLEEGLSRDPVVARLAAAAAASALRWAGSMRQLPPLAESMRVVRLGLEHAGREDSEALAGLLTAVAFAPFAALDRSEDSGITPEEALEAGNQAREMASRLAAPAIESAALDALMSHALGTGRIQQAAAVVEERMAMAEAVADPQEAGDTYAMAAWLAYDLGDYRVARERAEKGFARAIDDAPSVAVHNLAWSALGAVETGDWDAVVEARSTADELLDEAARRTPPPYAAPLLAAAAMVAEFRDDPEEAERLLGILEAVWSGSDMAGHHDHPLAPWARHTVPVLLRRDAIDEAREVVAAPRKGRIGHEADRLAQRCEVVSAAGAWEEADGAVAEARAVAVATGLRAPEAYADRLEGRASAASGDSAGGLALLAGARERFLAMGADWEAARTSLELARLGARDHLAEAAAVFRTAGAAVESAAAESLDD